MKKTILTAITVMCAVGAFAQGTVIFNNRIANTIIAHVYDGGSDQVRGNTAIDFPVGATSTNGLTLIGTTGGLGAATTFASLLGAVGANPMLVGSLGTTLGGGTATTFRTGAAAGNIVGVTATFNNIPKDSASANFQMVAWDNTSGLYSTWALASVAWGANLIHAGSTAVFAVSSIGGDLNPAPALTGLTSFNIYAVPEPTTIALAGLGAAALVIFRRRK